MKLTLLAALLTVSLISLARLHTVAAAQPSVSQATTQSTPDTQLQISAIGGGATNPWRSPYKTA